MILSIFLGKICVFQKKVVPLHAISGIIEEVDKNFNGSLWIIRARKSVIAILKIGDSSAFIC